MRPITVEVEEHDGLPEGCLMRFSAIGESSPVDTLEYENERCEVRALDENDLESAATQVLVDDSASGQSLLVYGGAHGLRIRFPDGRCETEAYLLLSP